VDPVAFSSALAAANNRLAANPDLRAQMGRLGRQRALEHFSWDSIAERTLALYRSLR
jgi:starch synthase